VKLPLTIGSKEEKLTTAHLFWIFPVFYGARKFGNMCKTSRQFNLH